MDPSELLRRNRDWARATLERDPGYFSRLSGQTSPRFLWVGCSDSRVSADAISGLAPGEVFVHRNIGNVVPHADLNVLTVLAYAVDVLAVGHIIVVGHYGCGGINAALDGKSHGILDNWLRHIKDVASRHGDQLESLAPEARARRLVELNAVEQARNLCHTSIVQAAWARGHDLTVRAWVYGLEDGILRDTRFVVNGPDDVSPAYRLSLEER